MAQGLLYSHFQGKEDLLRAIFRLSMDDVRKSFAAAAADPGRVPAQATSSAAGTPPGTRAGHPLELLVRSACALLRRNLDFWKLSYGVRMQDAVVKTLGPDLHAWTREILAVLEGHFRAARSPRPRVEAALFFAALDGICQHFVLDPRRYPLDEVAGALVARFSAVPMPRKQGGPHASRSPRPIRRPAG